MPDKRDVDIERAHRVKSRNPEKCTFIVKFTKFKDRECVINKANEVLTKTSEFSVHPDYTDKVKQQRRVLGERMLAEREKGHYSAVRYDKLIIEDKIYKVDDVTQNIVYVGRRQQHGRPRAHVNNNTNSDNPLAGEDHVDRGASAWGSLADDFGAGGITTDMD